MIHLLKLMGFRWLAFRLTYALHRKLGILQLRTPKRSWSHAPTYTLGECQIPHLAGGSPEAAIRTADRILSGELCYFSRHWFNTGFPPQWFEDPFHSTSIASSHQHWTKVSDSGDTDIKIIWEPSRFAFAFPLAKAFSTTQDERYAEGFWDAVEDWRKHNPPNTGPNWMCGQEIAIRMIAWVHALGLAKQAKASTPARLEMLAQMIGVSAERISANITYALSQRNNHGISEANGLFTAGVVLGRYNWQKRGLRLLERLGRTLICDDGSFSQDSVNYHRVMLDNYHWAIALAEANDIRFSDGLHERIKRAEEWMRAMTDEASGRAPNLGGNDGAWILPDAGADYLDYRSCMPA